MATAGKAVVLPSGKRGVLAGGKAAVFDAAGKCAVCCGACVNCSSAQPDADVATTGVLCQNATGTYAWSAFDVDADFCNWEWSVGDYMLQVTYAKASSSFLQMYVFHWNGSTWRPWFYKVFPDFVGCNPDTGEIYGTGALSPYLFVDCSPGDTCTVTFGGGAP